MGRTTVSANLDNEVLLVEYQHVLSQPDSVVPVPLVLSITYENTSSLGSTNVVNLFDPISIDSSSIEVDGNLQTAQVRVLNPRYRQNLFAAISETRGGIPLVTKVAILTSSDSVVTPSNPVRDETELLAQATDDLIGTYRPYIQLENDIGLPAFSNDVVPELPLLSAVYEFPGDPLEYVQGSRKIILSDGSLDFMDSGGILIENSSYNMLPDPQFSEPLSWQLEAPGQAVSLSVVRVDKFNTNRLVMSVASPNPFSAMDVALLKWPYPISIPNGQQYLSFSLFAKLSSKVSQTLQFAVDYYDSIGTLLSTATKTEIMSPSKNFSDFGGTFDVPALASSVLVRFGVINISEKFAATYDWPQLEPSAVPTSRVFPIGSTRKLDIVRTRPIEFGAPIYVSIKTVYRASLYILGLLDTTTNLLSGIQWSLSGNQMSFVMYDANGDATYTTSSPFVATDGDDIKLAFWLTDTNVDFFCNDALVSSHALIYSIPSVSKTLLVGNLHQANQTIQSSVKNFRVSKIKPS